MLRAFIEENFADKKLIVITNREPYVHKKAGSGIKVEKPAGGVTSALDDVMRAVGGTWVAWGSGSSDREAVDGKDCIMVPPENPSYTLKRVWLSPTETDNYYHGYSNHLLWPLCHITLDRVYYRKRFWQDYKKVNQYFAAAVLKDADKNSIVWIHDFHLCLVPKMLREKEAGLTIAHFWHIPWPDWSVFRVCPQSKELLEGLLGNDLIGFQISLFAKNFMECVKESLDAEIDYNNSTIAYKGHITRLKAFPISIDYDKFNSMASSQQTEKVMENIRHKYKLNNSFIGIGVDRLEYTKALIKRLQAIDLFFERYERFRERFTFIQIAVPTRMKEPYISYKETVEGLITKINKKYSKGGWEPIIYIDRKVEHKYLAAYYRLADVAIISSVYDGMNLVAKEYAASQADENGALILSELAGAADELEGAILVNPYDIEGFSDSIKAALTLPKKEKAARMSLLRRQIEENDIFRWVINILREMLSVSSMKCEKCGYLFDRIDEIKDKLEGKKLLLFLDYDGTLTPIVESPDMAVIPDDMRSLLAELRRRLPIAVISGRSLEDIKKRVGIEGIIYAGNHGAEIWDGEKTIASQQSFVSRDLMQEFLNRLKESLSPINGVLIEDKGITASIHYRMVKERDLPKLFKTFTELSKDYKDSFRIVIGKKVFEIRPVDIWDKGDAVSWIIKNIGNGSAPIYIGDDATDEDAFKILRGKGINICIGGNAEAEYYLKNQKEVKDILQWLLKQQQ